MSLLAANDLLKIREKPRSARQAWRNRIRKKEKFGDRLFNFAFP